MRIVGLNIEQPKAQPAAAQQEKKPANKPNNGGNKPNGNKPNNGGNKPNGNKPNNGGNKPAESGK